MNRTLEDIEELVAAELNKIEDDKVLRPLRALLVKPELHERNWDYGKEGEVYPCWMVMEHPASGTGIMYSDYGFGPKVPWGLAGLNDHWFGMDCNWYPTLEYAFRESFAFEDVG